MQIYIVIFFIVCLIPVGISQTPNEVITTKPVFSNSMNLIRRHAWFPICVEVTNTGLLAQENIDTLELSSNFIGGYWYRRQNTFFKTIVPVSSRTQKEVLLYVRPSSDFYTLRTNVSYGKKGLQGVELEAKSSNRDADNFLHIVTIADNEDDEEQFLEKKISTIPWSTWSYDDAKFTINPALLPGVFVSKTLKKNLPDRWMGYEGVDVVIISDFSDLAAIQLKAIEQWIHTGGILILHPRNINVLRYHKWVENLLGMKITPTNHYQNEDIDILSQVERTIATKFDNQNLIALQEKNTALSNVHIPNLAWSKTIGFGSVIYLGINYSGVKNTDIKADVWKYLVFPMIHTSMMYRNRCICEMFYIARKESYREEYDFATSLDFSKKKNPSITVVVLIILAYFLVIAPMNFIYLRRREKTIHLVWTIPIISLCFLCMIILYGYFLKGSDNVAHSVRLVYPLENGSYTYHSEYVGLMSGARNFFDISIHADGYVMQIPTIMDRKEESNLTYFQNTSIGIPSYSRNLWQMGYFRGVWLSHKIPITLSCKGNNIILHNTSGLELSTPIVITHDGIMRASLQKEQNFEQTYELEPIVLKSIDPIHHSKLQEIVSNEWQLTEEQKEEILVLLQKIDLRLNTEENLIARKSIPSLYFLSLIQNDPKHVASSAIQISPNVTWHTMSLLCLYSHLSQTP